MVRNYKRKTDRGNWSEETMRNAITAVLERKMGYYLAAKTYSVPQSTLERKVKKARENKDFCQEIKVPLGPKSPTFSAKEEAELVEYLKEMECRFYGLTTNDLKILVYQLATKTKKKHPFNESKGKAGNDWLRRFLKRHPDLAIRKPESTSAGFNKVAVESFYKLLSEIYDKYQLTADRVYNCDEIGISIAPKTKSKIITQKRRKQGNALVSAEQDTTITTEICFSATGHYIPPMLVFPCNRIKPELMVNAPPGTWGVCSDTGWMTTELFLQWFRKFVTFSTASKNRPVLLLLDGDCIHTKSIELIDKARANGVIILCFPSHTIHRLQPLEVFMKPLSTYYDQAISSWLCSNPGRVVDTYQVAELFGKAFAQAANMSTAINGFKKCGIWPLDITVFTELDLIASFTADIPLNITPPAEEQIIDRLNVTQAVRSDEEQIIDPLNITQPTEEQIIDCLNVTQPAKSDEEQIIDPLNITQPVQSIEKQIINLDNTQPGCSFWPDQQRNKIIKSEKNTSFQLVSPKELTPLLLEKREKTAIITSSPHKNKLQENIITKKKTERKKVKKRRRNVQTIKLRRKEPKKRMRKRSSTDTVSSDDINLDIIIKKEDDDDDFTTVWLPEPDFSTT
ncbi:uncharacterized protein LOC105200151 isoform X2 [Solenopsis invicta]|nr:uncharacterized protein LOC105200151 isoform X2 [Solenopsis invicta]XP_011165876.1 uncharacterized protein LOC105200151 isoform X2 [Solenopsis invicta]XP_025993347.1 uncharacterized protein LOC105200151 isoform X2 [Solenopsis invicta]XP_025993348.1 uncharacterized protein LOC105200151 isoform X2 [Solenopsis invicta]XP_025993349.1 uncharacterized protein LOC105200151 isoform X2 [Solenopsis invicta]XP_039304789.1 uncharacterized protein LOC105200151 isoform X2 [Solenopsis invicta]